MMTSQFIALDAANTDLTRLGAQVISGIGFLGAGTIMMTGRHQIKGLTTAAGLWTAACIGIAVGQVLSGRYFALRHDVFHHVGHERISNAANAAAQRPETLYFDRQYGANAGAAQLYTAQRHGACGDRIPRGNAAENGRDGLHAEIGVKDEPPLDDWIDCVVSGRAACGGNLAALIPLPQDGY